MTGEKKPPMRRATVRVSTDRLADWNDAAYAKGAEALDVEPSDVRFEKAVEPQEVKYPKHVRKGESQTTRWEREEVVMYTTAPPKDPADENSNGEQAS